MTRLAPIGRHDVDACCPECPNGRLLPADGRLVCDRCGLDVDPSPRTPPVDLGPARRRLAKARARTEELDR